MDPKEGFFDALQGLRTVLDGRQAKIWTAMPGIIESVNLSAITVTVQPAIQALATDSSGKQTNVSLPVLQDVPLIFPRGGGYSLTFPVKQGDECLVVIASRCIDNWWQHGGVQPQFELRLHDLSDGFAIVGPYSQPKVIQNISSSTTQLRSDDGKNYVEVDGSSEKINAITLNASAVIDGQNKKITAIAGSVSGTFDGTGNQITLTAPQITLNGNTEINGNLGITGNTTGAGSLTVAGDVVGGAISLDHHVHTGVQSGAADTGPPQG